MATLPDSTRNVLTDAAVDLADVGTIDTGGAIVLKTAGAAEVSTGRMANPAWGASGASVQGRADANAIASDTNATGGVVATADMVNRDNAVVSTHTVTAAGGGGEIEITGGVTIAAAQTVDYNSFTWTTPAS